MTQYKKDTQYLMQYAQYLKKHALLLSVGFLLIPLISLFLILQPFLIQQGIDEYILKSDLEGLILICILFTTCVLLEFSCKSLQSFIFS